MPGAFELALSHDYPVLEYAVQFRETDLAFVTRMLERHGISYHFQHVEGAHVMVLSDMVESHPTLGARPYHPDHGHHQEAVEHFWHWHPARRVGTGAVRLTDYNFKKPNAAMGADAMGDAAYAHGKIESFDWPGDYLDQSRGKVVARLRTQSERGQDRRFAAEGDIPGLCAGTRVVLAGDDVPGKGLVGNSESRIVMNDQSTAVMDNALHEVMGNTLVSVGGSYTLYTGGSGPSALATQGLGAQRNLLSEMAAALDRPAFKQNGMPGDFSIISDGAHEIKVGTSAHYVIGTNSDTTIGDSKAEQIGRNMTLSVGENLQTNIGHNKTEMIGDRNLIVCGSSRIEMRSDGTVLIKGTNITIDGTRVVIKGSDSVAIKSPKIDQN